MCAELRGTRSTVVAVDPRDLGLSLSHGGPVLVNAKPLEKPLAVGGTLATTSWCSALGQTCRHRRRRRCGLFWACGGVTRSARTTQAASCWRMTAPKCFYQAKVFHELNPRKIELLQDVFSFSLRPHLCRPQSCPPEEFSPAWQIPGPVLAPTSQRGIRRPPGAAARLSEQLRKDTDGHCHTFSICTITERH